MMHTATNITEIVINIITANTLTVTATTTVVRLSATGAVGSTDIVGSAGDSGIVNVDGRVDVGIAIEETPSVAS